MKNTAKHMFMLAAASLLIAVSGCKKDDDGGNSDADIQPGVGLKEIRIGDTAQKAFDVLGTVTDSHIEINGIFFHFLLYINKGIIINFEPTDSETLDPNTKILAISLIDPYSGKTDSNIGIGSTRADVIAAYGQPDSIDTDGESYDIGITFQYDNDIVSTITIIK